MQLVEQHVIDRSDPRFAVIDAAAFKSKNLYNASLYEIRQSFIHAGVYLDYDQMPRRMQSHESFKALSSQDNQQALILLHKNSISFFRTLESYKESPSKFTERLKFP